MTLHEEVAHVFFVRCDLCGKRGPRALTERDAESLGRAFGWSQEDKTWECPRCVDALMPAAGEAVQ